MKEELNWLSVLAVHCPRPTDSLGLASDECAGGRALAGSHGEQEAEAREDAIPALMKSLLMKPLPSHRGDSTVKLTSSNHSARPQLWTA